MVKIIEPLLLETRALYEAMNRFDARASKAVGLHPSDLRCVNALEKGPLTPGELGHRLGLTSGSVSTMLDRLERDGWIDRERDEADSRRVRVSLRPEAYRRASRVFGGLGRAIEKAFRSQASGDVAAATEALRRLREGFDAA